MKLEEKVIETIEKYNMLSPGDTIVVGVSGGADSTALLSVLCSVKEKFDLCLHIAHINHKLRGDEANRDSDYVRSLSQKHGLPFHLLECDVAAKAKELGISEEAAGREVRYNFFNEILSKNGGTKIAVAHNKGDSTETTLINLIRGSSLNGLKGICAVNGNIIRPLIECDRESIEEYLAEKSIPFMTDSTNGENIYTRNIIRNTVIPDMLKINPRVVSTIYENSILIGDEDDFISKVCDEYAKKCITCSNDCVTVDFSQIPQLHIAAKRRLIFKACEMINESKRNISSVNINSVLSLPTGGRTFFNGIFAERCYDRFIFTDKQRQMCQFSYIAEGETLSVPETGMEYSFKTVSAKDITKYEKNTIYLDADTLGVLTIRSRRDGDTFSPLGLGGRKKVKDFLIDMKIPRIARDRMPVLETDGHIAALLCLRPDEAHKITDSTTKILMISEVQR